MHGMPRRRSVDHQALDDLLRLRERVVTHADLMELGVPRSTIVARIQPRGRWQRLHPGVVLAHTGRPTFRERLRGALAYAGPESILTGLALLRLYGLKAVAHDQSTHVLVPHERRRQARDGVRVERVRRLPTVSIRSGLRAVTPARATVDACRNLSRLADVRELVAEVVQTGLCRPGDLVKELDHAARQRTALPRLVLAEIAAGVRSAAEARVREIFSRWGVQQPRWNWSLHTLDGEHVVTPDGWWELIGCALQIDSMAWHLSPERYRRTQHLQRAMGRYDVPFLPIAPRDVFEDEEGFVTEVRAFLARHADHVPTRDLIARPPG